MMEENASYIVTFLIGIYILYSLEPANQRDDISEIIRSHFQDFQLLSIMFNNVISVAFDNSLDRR